MAKKNNIDLLMFLNEFLNGDKPSINLIDVKNNKRVVFDFDNEAIIYDYEVIGKQVFVIGPQSFKVLIQLFTQFIGYKIIE